MNREEKQMQRQEMKRKQKFRKHQHTKPYKDRDRQKDFGKNLPLVHKRRLKFPQKPQYYTLYTAKKLPPDHPFYNIRNKDMNAVARAVKEAKEILNRSKQGIEEISSSKRKDSISQSGNDSIELRSSIFHKNGSQRLNSSQKFKTPSEIDSSFHPKTPSDLNNSSKETKRSKSNELSLSIVTVTEPSDSKKSCPFNRGFSVTSGPKVYKGSSRISISQVKSSDLKTPLHSDLSSKEIHKGEIISDNYINELYEHSERPSF